MKIMNLVIISIVAILSSCSKGSSGGGSTNVAPTNLNLIANVSTNNSGNVTFTATATNAVNYDFDFGNGIFQASSSGIVTYKYPSTGNYTVNVIAKSQSNLTVSKSIQITVSVAQSLLFSDEFDTPGAPDPSKWGYDIGTGSGGWGNNELQYYTNRSDNVVVSNGTLKIIAKKENFSGSAFTSARLLSQNKFSFKYGKVEARAKLPFGVGTWPAIWMLGNNISTAGWPACGEIDIMEHRGSEQNKIHSTLHYPNNSGGNGKTSSINIPNVSTEFQIYTCEWSATEIKFSVNNQVFFTFANNNSIPFNQNFFLILNVAMGGNFGGAVDPNFVSSTMEIDYIRVYQ